LILGINSAGRVVQHDRIAPGLLSFPGDSLLGMDLIDLVNESGDTGASVSSLLDAVEADREASAVLSVRTRRNCAAEAVVTVQPMQDTGRDLAALVIMRLPPPADEQFLDPAVMRQALLDDSFRQIGGTLDLDQMARGLANIVVPHFCNAASLLVLESLVAADEYPDLSPDGSPSVRRMAVAVDNGDPDWEAAFPTGEVLRYPPGTPYAKCVTTPEPVLLPKIEDDAAVTMADLWLRRPVAKLLARTSKLLLPLTTQGSTLGFFVCTRRQGFRAFDAYDVQIGMEFANRAAIFLENARRYNRERATALTLQRSLLPTGLSAPSSVEVSHRYLPGSQLIEVGGDWYESIALPGARVALVVGDVAGHGVRAAVTMGRLRTAIRVLAMLELPPAESLHQLNEIMAQMGDVEPHFATCAYALYDAVSGTCEIASAGHLPPLLVSPQGKCDYLDVTPAPPLGVGDGLVSSQTFDVEDGSLLVLYTDGLVESRGQDIDDGLGRLQAAFSSESAARSVEDLCKAVLTDAYAEIQRDDIAILMARLSRINTGHQMTWTLPSELTSAGRARNLVSESLERWELSSLAPITKLLVSELITNAIRYTDGDVTLRLVLEHTLTLEVLDSSPALPRLRHAARDDERGRGLQIVSQLSHRWGTRRTPAGKVVWCEQQLPETSSAPADDEAELALLATDPELAAAVAELTADAPETATAPEPATTQPATTQPATTGSAIAEPAAAGQATGEPATTEQVTQPELATAGATATGPAATGPAATGQANAGPALQPGPAIAGAATGQPDAAGPAGEPTASEPAAAPTASEPAAAAAASEAARAGSATDAPGTAAAPADGAVADPASAQPPAAGSAPAKPAGAGQAVPGGASPEARAPAADGNPAGESPSAQPANATAAPGNAPGDTAPTGTGSAGTSAAQATPGQTAPGQTAPGQSTQGGQGQSGETTAGQTANGQRQKEPAPPAEPAERQAPAGQEARSETPATPSGQQAEEPKETTPGSANGSNGANGSGGNGSEGRRLRRRLRLR
jgi:serine phosphatase RsbU (regulator of sigma subunit)